ncbi:hypothetical protein [Alterisphingorhabdus coralli]|uniref:Uncharacterized protein n=1 Tax=Alterisphingorhabdus coralli TaxID=3071408 RepID=A0AA97F487_9SPHN|nr:hypothetical protein [Parasphingorhabdus sp. SCSIO 66989]WOE74019.1 hypothetical protein RB602_09100 [Parasphingorhabdus sp. SCSIO 66989]
MLITALTLMVTAQAMDADSLRKAYSNCMVDVTIENLDNKVKERAFRKVAEGACPAERAAYMEAIVKDEMEYDASQEDAEAYATEEANGIIEAMAGGYRDMAATNTRPSKED